MRVELSKNKVSIGFFEILEKNKRGKYGKMDAIDALVPIDLLELYEKLGG